MLEMAHSLKLGSNIHFHVSEVMVVYESVDVADAHKDVIPGGIAAATYYGDAFHMTMCCVAADKKTKTTGDKDNSFAPDVVDVLAPPTLSNYDDVAAVNPTP